MATSDFLPFATGGGANVVSQAAYAALPAVSTGYQSGVAQSAQLNKTWRQSSIMAAVLAQFIVQQTGQNATDDGTTAALLANLTAAIGASTPGVVGQMRNLVMSVTAASATATITADEIIVETALGGLRYCLASFNKTINLATTGAGGMDTGSAPASGFVAIYAIYNPTTGASALLAKDATSAAQPNVYGGANMPAGYTASALIAVRQTTSGGLFAVGFTRDRIFSYPPISAFTSTTAQTTPTAVSISGVVPKNAIQVTGYMSVSCSVTGTTGSFSIAGDSSNSGALEISGSTTAGIAQIAPFAVQMNVPQTVYYTASVGSGSLAVGFNVSGYSI